MHPILFEIPLTPLAAVIIGVLMGAGALIRHRYAPADADSNYLATLLGLGVKWGEVRHKWGPSIVQGVVNGAIFAGLVIGAKYAVPKWFPEYAPEPGHPLTLPLHIYGIMMATAFLVAIWLATREAAHEQLPNVTYVEKGKKVTIHASDLVSDLAFYVFISGLVGSRLLYIITRWDAEYAANPLRAFNPIAGGLVWYGGLIAATLTSAWFIRKHNVAFLPYADLIVPGVSIAHGIGRLGCFAAGCCFGNKAPEAFPLVVHFPPGSPAAMEYLPAGLGASQMSPAVYPTQIMEALGEVLIFSILLYIRSRKRFHGQVVLSYFFMYAILRTVMEMFRGDSIRGFLFKWPNESAPMLLSTSQAVSILVAIAGIVATIVISRSRASTEHGLAKAA